MRGRVAFPPSRAGLRAASRPSARPALPGRSLSAPLRLLSRPGRLARPGPQNQLPCSGRSALLTKKAALSGGRKIALYSKKSAPVPPFTMALVRSSALLKYHSAPEKSTAISLHHGLSSAFWAHDNSPLGPDDLPAALVFKYIPPPFSQQLPAAGASHLLLAIPSHSVCPSRACAYLRASPCQITVPRPAEAPPTVCTTR